MESVSNKVLDQAVKLLGNPHLSHEEVEAELRKAGVKERVAQRLASFVPEAFGIVAAMHMKRKPAFQSTFRACDVKGEWVDIPFSSEPIFEQAKNRAEMMDEEGSGSVFEAISKRSSVMEVIDDALDKKTFYDGAIVAIETGVPAEAYLTEEKDEVTVPVWKRVLRELGAVEVEHAEVVLWGLARWNRS